MDSSDGDSDLEQNRQLMFLAISVKRRKGKDISERERCNEIEGYLDEGVGINAADAEGNTVLHVAVKRGLTEVVIFLLERGALNNIENNQGDTAITLAKKLGKLDIARILSGSGGNPSDLLAGPSRIHDRNNAVYDSGSVSPSTSRKRTADIDPGGSRKKSKFNSANETPCASRPGAEGTVFKRKYQGSRNDEVIRHNPRWDSKDTYDASGAKHALHGVIYQLKQLALTLNIALKMGYRFRLATEIDSAEKFDDLVFEYEDGAGSRVHRFVQLKHKQDDTKMIKVGDLLAEDTGEFSVKKYFTSWRKVKKHSDFDGSESKSFFLCTNIGIDLEDLENGEIDVIPVNESDDFLKVRDRQAQPPRYKLRPARRSKLYDKLKSASDVHQLAKTLARCVHDSDEMTLKTDIFKRYHTALAQEVLIHIDKKKRKFSDTFVNNNGLSQTAGNFRDIFFTYMKQFTSSKNRSDTNIWNDIHKKLLKTSESFGKLAAGSDQTDLVKLPDDDITDKEISDFLDEFVLAVNQPNEVELGELIKREFGEYSQFNLLNTNFIGDSFQNVILDWFKSKQGVYLVREDAEKFFNEMERELSSLISVGLNLPYPAKLKKYDVRFTREIVGLRNFLNSSNSTENIVWQWNSFEQTLLTALRIYQTLDQMNEYKKNDSFIFIELENLLLPVITGQVFRAFQSSSSHHLLIIDCGSDSTRQDTDQLWKKMSEIMTKLDEENITGKRIILIIPRKDSGVVELELAYKTSYEAEGDISIDKLDRATQQKLLGKKVIQFQGRKQKTSFRRLLGTDSIQNVVGEKLEDYRQIMNPKTLVRLIQDEELQIGGRAKGLGEIVDYYIPRTIDRRVVIKHHVITDSRTPDVFAISGIVRETFEELLENENRIHKPSSQRKRSHLTKWIILGKDRETDHFDCLCQQNPNLNIHWLQHESSKFVWMKSFGCLANLFEYRGEATYDNDDDSHSVISLSDEQLAKDDEGSKIMILSDIAGMGKSTVLTYLAERIKEINSCVLVIKIDLTQHVNALDMRKGNPCLEGDKTQEAVDFLLKDLLVSANDLEFRLFRMIIKDQTETAIILFDGFDEISPDYEDTVIDLLQELTTLRLKKLFVTTRPHTRQALEMKLGTFSYKLQPFSPDNQIDFLSKFWRRGCHSNLPRFILENRLKRYAKAVIDLLAKSINHQMKEFTGIPLQTRLVAEYFQDLVKCQLSASVASSSIFDEDVLGLPKKIGVLELFSSFVDKKYNIYWDEKKSGNRRNPADIRDYEFQQVVFSKAHQKFSLDALFDKETAGELLLSQPDVKSCIQLCQIIIEGGERTGIVIEVINGKPQFIHRTFAEYFAALFLVKAMEDNSLNQQLQESFVSKLFVKEEYQVIRAFINCLLAGKTLVEYSLKFDVTEHRDLADETAYHIAARERHVGIARFLVNCLKSEPREVQLSNINCTSAKGDKETPLHVAVQAVDNFDIMKCFVDAGADVNFTKSWVQHTPLHNSIGRSANLDMVEYLIEHGGDVYCQSEIGSALHYATFYGHLDVVKHLLNKGVDINVRNDSGYTPLHHAIKSGNKDLVEYLVTKGADVNSQTTDGKTPLHNAADSGNLQLAKPLIDNGADIHSQTKVGKTPLHNAAASGNLGLIMYLTMNGANIHSKTADGGTILHSAVESHKQNVIERLIEEGADIHSQNKDSETPLHLAAKSCKVDIVKHLVENGANIESQNKDGRTPLYYAAGSGRLDTVKYLLENGADIHSRTKQGRTLLHSAAHYGDLDTVKYLTERMADIDIQDENGRTPLYHAAGSGDLDLRQLTGKGADAVDGETPLHSAATFDRIDVVQYLIEKGADINSQTKDGRTPLYHAVESINPDILEHLLEQGADVHAQTKKGKTVLHLAAQINELDMVKLLTEKGADIDARDQHGRTPLDYAACYGCSDVVIHLSEKGADIHSQDKSGTTPLHYAVDSGDLDVIKHLLGRGADAYVQNRRGNTPLHIAVYSGNLEVVKYFLKEGVDINHRFENCKTLLHLAATAGDLSLVNYLLAKGADFHSRDQIGYTALQYAAHSGNLDLVNHLLDNGADINSQSKKGRTLLHSVAARGDQDMVNLSLKRGADSNCQDENGVTPLHFAACSDDPDVLKLLTGIAANRRTQTKDDNTPPNCAKEFCHLDVVRHLLENGANINSRDKDDRTPLHLANLTDSGFQSYSYKHGKLFTRGRVTTTHCGHGFKALHQTPCSQLKECVDLGF